MFFKRSEDSLLAFIQGDLDFTMIQTDDVEKVLGKKQDVFLAFLKILDHFLGPFMLSSRRGDFLIPHVKLASVTHVILYLKLILVFSWGAINRSDHEEIIIG